MRILVICELFEGGGLETQIVSTLRMLEGRGIDVFLSTSPGYNKRLLNGLAKDVLELDFLNLHSQNVISNVQALVNFINLHQIDLVHFHPYYSFWPGYLSAIVAEKPFVCTLHSPFSFSLEYGLAYQMFQKYYVFPQASAVFVVSPELERSVGLGGSNSRSRVVLLPNAIDTDHFRPSHTVDGTHQKRIAVISRLDRRKVPVIRDWLSIFQELRDGVPPVTCVIVGDGPERPPLEQEVKSRHLAGEVRFLGYTSDVRSVMQSCSLVVGMERVVLEAAAMNIPVVLAGYEGVNGLVDVENFRIFADANFSGRGFRKDGREKVLQDIRTCLNTPEPRYQLRALVLENHMARTAAESYAGVLYRVLQNHKSYSENVHAHARLLMDHLRTTNVSLLDATGLFDFFLSEGLPHQGLQERLERVRVQLAEKEREVEERDRILEVRRIELAEKDRRISERDAGIAERDAEIAERDAEIELRGRDLAHARSELLLAREDAGQVRLELNKILNLRSYRLMQPLRRAYWHAHHVKEHAGSLRLKAEWIFWKAVRITGSKFPLGLKRTARRALEWRTLRRDPGPWKAELERILAQHQYAKGVVIYPPTLDWQFMFQRPQQLAQALARAGYLFLYCTDNARVDRVEGFERVEENLFVCHVPWRTFAVVPKPVVLVTWAVHRPLLQVFNRPTVIYDCLDDLEVGATPVEEHEHLLHRADIVLATSGLLFERIRSTRPDVVFCPNAADYESFAKARTAGRIPDDLQPILKGGRKIIGYHGALARWFNYELLAAVARAMDHLSFVLVGVDYDGTWKRSALLDIPNVHWLGLKRYGDLPDYLRCFNVGTIPFAINSITEATSPIKLWEYLAAGKPVVSTDLPMCRGQEGVFIAHDVREFCTSIERAIEESQNEGFRSRLQKLARENTWNARAAQIIAALETRSPAARPAARGAAGRG